MKNTAENEGITFTLNFIFAKLGLTMIALPAKIFMLWQAVKPLFTGIKEARGKP